MELEVNKQPELKQGIGTWAAFLRVMVSPSQTFARLIEAPKTWLPSLYLIILAAVFTLPFLGKYQEYTKLVLDKTMTATPPTGVNIDQMKQLTVTISTVSTLIGVVLSVSLIPIVYAALLKLLNFVMGEEVKFKQLWTITVFAQVPAVLGILLNNLLLLSASGNNMLLTVTTGISIGALVPKSAVSIYLLSVLSSLKLFSIWSLVLIVIGTAGAFRSKALRVGTVIFGVWLAYILLAALAGQNALRTLLG